jgi:hypothetical protein
MWYWRNQKQVHITQCAVADGVSLAGKQALPTRQNQIAGATSKNEFYCCLLLQSEYECVVEVVSTQSYDAKLKLPNILTIFCVV